MESLSRATAGLHVPAHPRGSSDAAHLDVQLFESLAVKTFIVKERRVKTPQLSIAKANPSKTYTGSLPGGSSGILNNDNASSGRSKASSR